MVMMSIMERGGNVVNVGGGGGEDGGWGERQELSISRCLHNDQTSRQFSFNSPLHHWCMMGMDLLLLSQQPRPVRSFLWPFWLVATGPSAAGDCGYFLEVGGATSGHGKVTSVPVWNGSRQEFNLARSQHAPGKMRRVKKVSEERMWERRRLTEG